MTNSVAPARHYGTLAGDRSGGSEEAGAAGAEVSMVLCGAMLTRSEPISS